MTPLPQETTSTPNPGSENVLTGEEVVISGISGLFPSSDNVYEFMDNLYNKVDMVTENDTIFFDHADLPKYSGLIKGIHKFDAQFFRVTQKQADIMEPMIRKLMEQAYCAMYDAGVNPLLYKEKKIGVFSTELYGECGKFICTAEKGNPFLITGGCQAMLSNRISYWLDAKGPSFTVEHWSGSAICLQNAIDYIRSGICDAAIVGGAEFTTDPVLSVNLRNAGLLCLDGKTRCFDKDGDGYVKSQAMGVLFLQKAKDAKRIYAELHKVGIEYSFTQGAKFNQMREPNKILNFLSNFYSETDVSANDVEYVEAHGAAIPEADASELQAIGEMFGKKKPVMVGCVKSNMGCGESVSGICAVTKLCLAYHKGKIAGNLHYDNPLDITAIKEGRIAVLTDNTPFNRGYTAVNNFSYTGTNCHIVLKGHFKPKNSDRYKCNMPRLVLISARHEKGLEKIFKILKEQPIDPELLGMLNNIYQIETPGFTCRGYTILDTKDEKTVSLAHSTALYQGTPRPLWLVFSGMGSQWAGMGTELMRIPVFAAAIEKCCKMLQPKGVDVVRILTSPDKTIFDSVLNAFIGIAAVQIGLIDILKRMGVVPDNIIGHSLGEMGCAYYDGCFSAEEMILVAYARGLVSIETKLIKGSMAAVGLGYQDMLDLCPPEIDIACHNSAEFCTLSGPADVMKTFVAELTEKGIFAKEVQTGNIAYHSRYIQDAGPSFLKLLREIIKTPAKRSDKWITTSWPEDKWNEPAAQLSSAEYHTNNLLSPVYFEEAARLIPSNAVVVEIAPHGLMQAILKRSHPECTHIPLTRRGHSNALEFLFSAFGKLYKEGYNLKVDIIYPKIEYPVSTETSILSHFVEWYHEEDWTVRTYDIIRPDNDRCIMPSRTLAILTKDDDYKFLLGHHREGNIVFPEAAILFYIWETLAMYKGVNYEELSVSFCDVHFLAEVVISAEETVKLKFTINKGNQYFEVTRDDVLIANGSIITIAPTLSQKYKTVNENSDSLLTSDDIYKLMNLKGHYYQNEFRSIKSCSPQWESSQIRMTGNWITFIDSLIQLNILTRNYNGISVPKIIKNLTINMADHNLLKTVDDGQNIFDAVYSNIKEVTRCGGMTLRHIFFNDKPVEKSEPDVLKTLSPHPNNFEGPVQRQLEVDSFIQNLKMNRNMNYKLVTTKLGSIDRLKWTAVDEDKSNTVKVCYAGPSMRDVQIVVGLRETKPDYGMDFSGVDSKGNRVMGLVAGGALASSVKPHQDLLWPVPEHWTLEEAATVPLPYIHAFYCMIVRGRVRSVHSVFVNGGAGALGQAVISLCLSLGCTVYTSVGDLQKKRFLMKLFPGLNEHNIGYSNDIHFHNVVLNNTEKIRCDFVINCATGYIRELAMKCVAVGGHFLDTSEYDMKQNINIGMHYLDEFKSYLAVKLSSIFKPENIKERKLLHQAMSEGIASGVVNPISYVVYPLENIDRAFRLLSLRRHIGRALIQVGHSDIHTTILNVNQRNTYPSEGVYLVICGDEIELGISLINHLVEQSATKFIFQTNAKNASKFFETQFALWKNMGIAVTFLAKDLQSKSVCDDILRTTKKLKGIFIIQPVLNRCAELKRDIVDNANAITSVVQNVDRASRHYCPELNYFVIFASSSENDVDKHTTLVLEKICEKRTEHDIPALVLRTELLNNGEHLYKNDSQIRPMSVHTAFKAMDISLQQKLSNVLAYNKKRDTCEFLERVARIMGIENINNVDENLYLKHFIFNETNFEEIKTIIKETYNLELPTKFIEEMRIHSLKNINKIFTKLSTNFDSKLAAFYNFVDHDVIRATEIFVPMSTPSSLVEGEQNLHRKAANLIIVPGFEGHHDTFGPMCETLKIRATTLQLGPDHSNESIQKIALDLKEKIKQRFILKPQFYLLGYSFGINVALEIAALLEKDGYFGVIYCLDSSPDALRVQLDAYLGEMSEEQLQNHIIKHMFYVMSGQNSKLLDEDVENLKEWTEKVDRCVEQLKNFVKYSNQYKKSQIESFYKRLGLARSYEPEFKLESNIVLLKGVLHPKADHLPADYGMSKYTKHPVKIFDINSDVVSAPYDSRVPNIVNQLLDSALLEDYKAKNNCESYSIAENIKIMLY